MRRRLTAMALVAVAAALVTAPAAPAAVEPYETVTPDGVTLRGWVHLPDGPGPFAPILEFTPYLDNNGDDSSSDPGGYQYLVEAGFALARVSMRGTGRSGGCLQFGDDLDRQDVVHTVNDLARRPWSTGNVGMAGHSFPAWSGDMGVALRPAPLKAVLAESGVIDLWSLVTRRGAPLAAGLGALTHAVWLARTGTVNQGAPEHAQCPNLPEDTMGNAETARGGDRTPWFQARDLRPLLGDSPVPMLRSQGMLNMGEGHILQSEGLWQLLRPDRTRFMLGQWSHQAPTRKDWPQTVTAWFDHYLRGGPQAVAPGVVEYQDDTMEWHTADRWPPRSRPAVVRLSGSKVVPDGERVEPADRTFGSVDVDPGPNVEPGNPRIAAAVCGPHQALWVSEPLAEDALLAGNFEVDLELSSTQPGGNFAVFVWKTSGSGGCPDSKASTVGRAMLDLRHWHTEGQSRDFPVSERTTFTLTSHPFASRLHKGERLVVAAGGGAVEMTPDQRKPMLTLHAATFRLPVVSAAPDEQGTAPQAEAPPLRFEPPSAPAARRCASRRRFTIRLRRSLARARVTVDGRRVRTVRRGGRLTARVDLRGMPRKTAVVRITGVTRSGRRVVTTRRYRPCATEPHRSRRWNRP
ncbi:MAG TPA: CocE/NonD family hydrolase [Solirubrobacteraceae bacterium]|nr:CocE/NonD family hydrolase [Solirubrobacteraceae bacterium]